MASQSSPSAASAHSSELRAECPLGDDTYAVGTGAGQATVAHRCVRNRLNAVIVEVSNYGVSVPSGTTLTPSGRV